MSVTPLQCECYHTALVPATNSPVCSNASIVTTRTRLLSHFPVVRYYYSRYYSLPPDTGYTVYLGTQSDKAVSNAAPQHRDIHGLPIHAPLAAQQHR